MVQIEEASLSSFKEDLLFQIDGVQQERCGIGDVLSEFIRISLVITQDLCFGEGFELRVQRLEHGVLEGDDLLDPLLELIRSDEISDPDGMRTPCLLLITGSDPAHGRADRFVLAGFFQHSFLSLMPRHDDMCAIADQQILFDFNSLPFESLHFVEEGRWIHDHAGTDDGLDVRSENSGGDEREFVFHTLADDGMSGVVAPLIADDQIVPICQQINDLSLGFITPLQSDNRRPRHCSESC